MQILPLQASDLLQLDELKPADWLDIKPIHEFYIKSPYCFPIKVVQDQQMVGIAASILHKDTAWLAHIVVHSEHRNKGIGQLITQYLVDSLIEKDIETIYLKATELGEPVYRKIGFEAETEYLFFNDQEPTLSLANTEDIIPIKKDFISQIAQLDYQVSGESRLSFLEPHFNSGFVYLEANKIEGFYLPTLGDGLIIANSILAGQELMKLRWTSKDKTVFPIDNLEAIALAQKHGLKEVKRVKKMRLGKERPWQAKNIYNRIGGNLG